MSQPSRPGDASFNERRKDAVSPADLFGLCIKCRPLREASSQDILLSIAPLMMVISMRLRMDMKRLVMLALSASDIPPCASGIAARGTGQEFEYPAVAIKNAAACNCPKET